MTNFTERQNKTIALWRVTSGIFDMWHISHFILLMFRRTYCVTEDMLTMETGKSCKLSVQQSD